MNILWMTRLSVLALFVTLMACKGAGDSAAQAKIDKEAEAMMPESAKAGIPMAQNAKLVSVGAATESGIGQEFKFKSAMTPEVFANDYVADLKAKGWQEMNDPEVEKRRQMSPAEKYYVFTREGQVGRLLVMKNAEGVTEGTFKVFGGNLPKNEPAPAAPATGTAPATDAAPADNAAPSTAAPVTPDGKGGLTPDAKKQ